MKLKHSIKIAVLSGGFEPENYCSNLTGDNILAALKNAGFKHTYKLQVNKNIAQKLINDKPDFAFLSLFCKWGEDGVIQSLLEILDIPYSGSGVETSALCKNKYFFSKFVRGLGLHTPQTYFYGNEQEYHQFDIKGLIYPCIVKGVYQGYSLGTSLVQSKTKLNAAIKSAFEFSAKITIEEYIDGKEFTVGIIDIPNKEPLVLPIIEIKFKKIKIQNTEVKDNPDLIEEIIPAPLTSRERATLSSQSLHLYNKLGCLGVARFDIRQKSNGVFYFLENNTCPGIISYEHSDLPKQLKSMGISLKQFVEYMIIAGLNRPETKREYIC